MALANIPKDFSSRYLNDGFSGGEKKRMELLQLALLRPEIAVLDETDSGLDIDALRTVADGVNKFAGPDMGVLIITHYQRILHMVKPDFVHVMFEGRIVKEGGPELVDDARGEGLRLDPRGGRRRPRDRLRPAPSRSSRSARSSRRSSARSRAGRSPTSTAAPAPSRCWPRSRRSTTTTAATTRTSTAAPTRSRAEATEAYEEARRTVAAHLGAGDRREVIFVRNATEAINLVARAWGDANVGAGDRLLLTEMEHHSNIVPWQQLAERVGAEIDWAPIDDEGRLDMDAFAALLERGPKLVAVAHVSNVLGTENPLAEIARLAHEAGALVLADGAQAAPKLPLDVAELGVDFYAVTGHKALRADRDRRALGPARAAARDAALPRRRLDDPQGDPRGHHLRRRRRPASRPGRRRSPRRSGWRRRCAGSTRSGWRTSAPTSSRSPTTPWRASPRSPACGCSGRRAAPTGSARSPSSSRASTPTTSPRSSTATASRSAPATTAPRS